MFHEDRADAFDVPGASVPVPAGDQVERDNGNWTDFLLTIILSAKTVLTPNPVFASLPLFQKRASVVRDREA